jgi:alpha-1,6-mannosyltransferase
MSGLSATAPAQVTEEEVSGLRHLALFGATIAMLTLAAPFAFKAGGDNAFMAVAVPAALLAIPATTAAERAPARAIWLIVGIAIALRIVALSFPPLLSTDIYRYIWDGVVQAAGINPYRYVPADPALAALRDASVYPLINRANYAPTIYPPVAQFFFMLVTRFAASTLAMRLALIVCEAVTVFVMILFLKRLGRPHTRIVAYLWHPLPVWEIANNGHVDGLMICLMLIGIWLVVTGRAVRGAAVVALAVLVKPFALPALAGVWRPWNWKMIIAVLATFLACYAPYLSAAQNVLGFLTKGYLTEEGISSGDGLWLLSLWRLAFGLHPGDVAVYMALAALLMLALALVVWRRPDRSAGSALAGINMLLLALLLLFSPNYEWYFLVVMPFVALCGNAPTWAATIGAILLTNEVETDFHISTMLVKSTLFGAVLLSALWSLRPAKATAA